MPPVKLEVFPVTGVPRVDAPCALAPLVLEALRKNELCPKTGDVLVVAHKLISKAEGRVVTLSKVEPSPQALSLAQHTGKAPELIEVILSESKRIVRQAKGVIICENRLGVICANAGVDRSNAGADQVVLLPKRPDRSARLLKDAIEAAHHTTIAVLVADTHGRPWREGAVGLCIGLAGVSPFTNYRGRSDLYDYEMQTKVECVVDELCAAATLVMGQGQEGIPLVLIRGAGVSLDPEACFQTLLRPADKDLFQ